MNQEISALQNTLIYHFIEKQAESNPDAIAIIAPKRPPLTYRQLWHQINNIVIQLNAIGVGRNDRVAIALNNGPEMAVAFLAIASAATCAPLNPGYSQREFDFYLSDLNAKALIIQSGIAEAAITVARDRDIPIIELSPILEAEAGIFTLTGGEPKQSEQNSFAQPDDIALVLHTSGTTSRPKIVPLTHRNLCASAQNIRTTLQLEKGDRCLNFMPLFHIHGLIGALLSSLSAGASIICTPGFYAPKFFEWLEEFRPTWYSAVPTMHQAILARAAANREIISRCPIRLIRSSSAALAPLVMAELENIFNAPVIEAYGMTEASHQMASNPLPPQVRKAGSVGVAAGPEIAIMDEVGNLLNQGEIGEIVIRGDNVTLGYENNPKANETAFTNGWFRTGDQGYLDSDRYLFIKGRLKEIINRGGEKISPREVDEVLLNHPAIASVVTFAIPHTQLGEEVGAAVVLRENASATEREIQEFAAAQMADFKVPRRVIFLDEIPKGPTGKLQRIGLAEKLGIAPLKSEESSIAFAHPSTIEEEKLTQIWLEVLGLEKIGVRDNFFQLGGDSILGLQIINCVRSQLQVELSFLSLWQNPTIAEMAVEITKQQTQPTEPIQPISRERELPLSFGQTRLWFLDQLEPGNSAYNRPVMLHLVGKLNVTALEESLNEIVRRHEVLRTTFPANVEGFPVQAIATKLTLSLPLIDLSNLPENQREAEAKRQVDLEVKRPFDLKKGPLLRAILWQLSSEKYLLFVGMHHIVFDGWSVGILLHEIAVIYEAFCAGKPSPLPELPIQYADFAYWQQQWLSGEVLESQLAYWKQQLSGNLPILQLPTERSQTPVKTFRGATQLFQLSPQLSEALNQLSRQEGVTLFMTLLAAFVTLLYRYSGQEDILLGSLIAGRNYSEIEALIGFFVNTLVLRIQCQNNPTFQELLKRVREVALGAYAHQDLPFEKLVEELHPERSTSHQPLFQVMFVLQNASNQTFQLPGAIPSGIAPLHAQALNVDNQTAKFDLTLSLSETETGIEGYFEYNTDLFEATTIARMTGHFQILLEAIVVNPIQHVSELPLLTTMERHQLLVEWNNTTINYPNKCIHQLFEKQVELTPDAVAVIFENQQLTYQELNERANKIAHYLQAQGVKPEGLVGICLERSLEMVVALLGILKAGGAYVPLDPNYPSDRLAFMLEDTAVPVLLSQQQLIEKIPTGKAHIICLDTEGEAIADLAASNPSCSATPDNLAYISYTSGSTGKPKGVSVIHRGVVRLVKATNYANLSAEEVFLHLAPLAFDASTFEIWGSLLNGARLIIMPPHTPSVEELGMAIQRYQITTLWLTSGLFNLMVDERIEDLKPVRQLLAGGDVLSVSHVRKFLTELPECQLINGYGPTENTTFSCCYSIADISSVGMSIPIGRPIANTQVYILDRYLQPVGIGVAGELYVGGEGLARGYWNRPDLTAEKFVSNPFANEPGEKLYKTGDRARYLSDGNIEFLGRFDNQVKIRGFRIELGEIEALLATHPDVKETTVIVREDSPNNKLLVAYIVPHSEKNSVTVSKFRSFLKDKLPDYMVPNAFILLDRMPLTPNGKIDRQNLPDRDRSDLETGFVPASDALEIQLKSIWQEVLGVTAIGVKDNFFELGGHSLLAVRLFAQIEKIFDKNLPLATLFQAPTIEQLANILRKKGWSSPWKSLVLIQPGKNASSADALLPLFCIHAVGGNVLSYQTVASYLVKERPVYGLQARGLDGKTEPHATIEEMAADYIKEMRIVQPHGPYFLVGHSSGGVVAFEIAQQLVTAGEKVALVALFDSYSPILLGQKTPPISYQLYIHWFNLKRLKPKEKLIYILDRVRWNLERLGQKITNKFYAWMSRPLPNELPEYLQRIESANRQAVKNYVSQVYPGKVTLFRAIERPTRKYYQPDLGWMQLAGEVEIIEVPGHHKTMILEPRVRFLGKKLQACLDRIQD